MRLPFAIVVGGCLLTSAAAHAGEYYVYCNGHIKIETTRPTERDGCLWGPRFRWPWDARDYAQRVFGRTSGQCSCP